MASSSRKLHHTRARIPRQWISVSKKDFPQKCVCQWIFKVKWKISDPPAVSLKALTNVTCIDWKQQFVPGLICSRLNARSVTPPAPVSQRALTNAAAAPSSVLLPHSYLPFQANGISIGSEQASKRFQTQTSNASSELPQSYLSFLLPAKSISFAGK